MAPARRLIHSAGSGVWAGMNFRRLAATSALLAAATNLGYSLSFLVVRPDNPDAGGTAASAFLLAGGLLALPVLLALYGLVKERAPELALLGTVLGIVGAVGAAVHGGHDLANAIVVSATSPSTPRTRGRLEWFASRALCLRTTARASPSGNDFRSASSMLSDDCGR